MLEWFKNTSGKFKVTVFCLVLAAVFSAGAFAGVKYLAPSLTQHHYTETTIIEKPTIVQGEIKTVTDTQVAYVPKETIIVKYIDSVSGQEVSKETLEDTDISADIGKTQINVKLNGKDIAIQKTDDEKFVFDKNKLSLTQSSTIHFDATVEPTVIDRTKRWSIGVGVGSNGIAGQVNFPIGNSDYSGGWIFADKHTQAGGVALKF